MKENFFGFWPGLGQKNNFFRVENLHFWFIGVHLVHWTRQPAHFAASAMNQMNLNVFTCCLWRIIRFTEISGVAAMNFESVRFIEVH